MKKYLAIALLLGSGLVNSFAHPAFAVRYTQIFPNAASSAPVAYPAKPPVTMEMPTTYTEAYTPVYQGQIRQSIRVPSLHNAEATRPLQSPQAILDDIKARNQVPANVAPKITVEKSNVLNSYTDGQNIVVTSNLLDKLNTSDQRAFVISHELSHVLLSHVPKTELRRMGLSLLDTFVVRRYVSQGSPLDLATQLGLSLFDKRSSRGFEYQADDLGVQLMAKAGYDPEAAIQVFDILKANTPSNQVPGFLMDHPITDDRIHALVQKYKLKPE